MAFARNASSARSSAPSTSVKAAALNTTSGLVCRRRARTRSPSVIGHSSRPNAPSTVTPCAGRCCASACPRVPLAPRTIARMSVLGRPARQGGAHVGLVAADHHLDQLLEAHLGLPAQLFARL